MNYSDLRAQARQNLQNTWPIAIAAAVVASLLGGLITGSSFLPNLESTVHIPILTELNQALKEGIQFGDLGISIKWGIPGIVTFLLGGTIELGYAEFLLRQHDRRDLQFSDLFSQFHRFGQGFAQHFLRTLYVTLWSFLLVIPGIMAGYAYAMTPFLMADYPSLTASEAIARSKELMDGHKMELFILDLTFLGWIILASLPWNLGFIALNPYTNATRAVFYRQLRAQTSGRISNGYIDVDYTKA